MGLHKSSFEQKVKWLVDRPEICRTWPNKPWTDDEVINEMRSAGVVSAGSRNYDIGDLNKPIAEARARIRSLRRA